MTGLLAQDLDDERDEEQPKEPAKKKRKPYVNWFTKELWDPIEAALKSTRFNSGETVKLLKLRYPNPIPGNTSGGPYERLTRQSIDNWLTCSMGGKKGLKAEVIAAVREMRKYESAEEFGGRMALNRGKERALEGHEELEKQLVQLLQGMRDGGQPVNAPVLRAVIKGVVEAEAPQLVRGMGFGGQWEISESWVRRYVRDTLRWTFRAATTAAQKLPKDWKEQLELMALRVAFEVQAYNIPEALIVNADQTAMHLVPAAGSRTYDKKGKREIAVTGMEDKRQITLWLAQLQTAQLYGRSSFSKGRPSAACQLVPRLQ